MIFKSLKIIDPYKITQDQCPVFIQSSDMRGILGFGIRERTESNWNHSMMMRRPGYLCSQNNLFREIPLKKYMTKSSILKFWVCEDITEDERTQIFNDVNQQLKEPWYKRFYDYLGVFGQLIGVRGINIEALNYCSERVRRLIKYIISNLKLKPTPEDIDTAFKESPRMKILGYWLNV